MARKKHNDRNLVVIDGFCFPIFMRNTTSVASPGYEHIYLDGQFSRHVLNCDDSLELAKNYFLFEFLSTKHNVFKEKSSLVINTYIGNQ